MYSMIDLAITSRRQGFEQVRMYIPPADKLMQADTWL
jgi:hypothetical protein